MAGVRVNTDQVRQAARDLQAAGPAWRKARPVILNAALLEAKAFIQRRFRQGGTTRTRTAVRTGRLLNAYETRVQSRNNTDIGSIGLLKPGTQAEVLRYGRIQEGISRSGAPVREFVIKPKRLGGFLTFPVRDPGGGNRILRDDKGKPIFVRVKEVRLKPRPSLPTVAERFPPRVEELLANKWEQAVLG